MDQFTIYNNLLAHFRRLNPEFTSWEPKMGEGMRMKMINTVVSDLIFSRLTPKDAKEAIKLTEASDARAAFKLPAVQSQALEIIKLMEEIKNWEEFEKQTQNPPQPPKELTDFDKILRAMLKVPPPKKDKKEKEGE